MDDDRMEIDETSEPKRRGRPPLNRAAPRSEPVREAVRSDGRRRRHATNDDRFALPGDVPEGLSYEWKRLAVLNKEDPFYIQSMRENGWEPVDASRHPGWMPNGYTGAIVKDGMMLMERPQELTDEANAEMRQTAQNQVRDQIVQLGIASPGEFARQNRGGKPLVNVSREYHAPMPVDGD